MADGFLGRAKENEMAFGAGSAAVSAHRGDLIGANTGQARGKLAGVSDRCRKQNEPGVAAVMAANPSEPSENLCDMTSENAPVGVHFIYDDIAELFPELLPFVVESQKTVMEHVRVGQKNVWVALAYEPPLVGGGVAVVDARSKGGHPAQSEMAAKSSSNESSWSRVSAFTGKR